MAAPCTTKTYQKTNGDYFCAFIVQDNLNWFQADDACKIRGARLPEISDVRENIDILKFRVSFCANSPVTNVKFHTHSCIWKYCSIVILRGIEECKMY
jgi:hypothetical protein